jgi:hypothetical protein
MRNRVKLDRVGTDRGLVRVAAEADTFRRDVTERLALQRFRRIYPHNHLHTKPDQRAKNGPGQPTETAEQGRAWGWGLPAA